MSYKTSKGFYNYLKSCGFESNYQYYVKIESGVSFPSSQVINQIAKILERHFSERLIKAYCADQFGTFDYLFQDTAQESMSTSATTASKTVNQGQKELTLKQIHALFEKKENYFLFLMLTLSRYPITVKELEKFSKLKKAIRPLVEVTVVSLEEDNLRAVSSEFVFPKAEGSELEAIYSQFDQWDIEFSSQFEFKKYVNKMMIRRISPRYFGVIQKQIETLTDFVRCSDESDRKYNNEVLHMHISLSKGNLPG